MEIVKPYLELYGQSRFGKTHLLIEFLNRLFDMFGRITVDGIKVEKIHLVSNNNKTIELWKQRAKFPFAVSKQFITQALGLRGLVLVIEDCHSLLTKTNARTFRRIFNG